MALISTSNFTAICDRLSAISDLQASLIGTKVGAVVGGTSRNIANNLLTSVTTLGDYEQQKDMIDAAYSTSVNATNESVVRAQLSTMVNSLINHIRLRGTEVSTTITDINTFLSYYNSSSTGTKYSCMVTPGFSSVFNNVTNKTIATFPVGTINYLPVICPAIAPYTFSANNSTNGMGSVTGTTAFSSGLAVNQTLYSPVNLVAVLTANFTGGTLAPTITVYGNDDTGLSNQTFTATAGSTNPTSAVSTTITPAVSAQTRSTVALGSTSGIVAGSILSVDTSTSQEYIVVESVASGNITAVFQKAHNAGAAVTGLNTLTLTPTVAGRRCTSVTNVTLNAGGWATTWAVRIEGVQDRVAI